MDKKNVMYLLGSGATHAVIKEIDPTSGLLTEDIQNFISKKTPKNINNEIWNEVIKKNNDVEHIISVLESQYQYSSAENIKRYYREAIVRISQKIKSKTFPINLYSALVDFHNIKDNNENLQSMVTLNYEDILEKSIKLHTGCEVDYVVENSQILNSKKKAIKVYKLHGSFNWYNNRPIQINKMSVSHLKDPLWIPPGVDKKKDNYPFNLLWGKFTENLLNCNVLRVIGCSLSRNDWSIIPILYSIQRFYKSDKIFNIEIIDFSDTSKKINKNYSYLNTKGLYEIPEIVNYFKNEVWVGSSDKAVINELFDHYNDTKSNPFHSWLDVKTNILLKEKIDISTNKNILHGFYWKDKGAV